MTGVKTVTIKKKVTKNKQGKIISSKAQIVGKVRERNLVLFPLNSISRAPIADRSVTFFLCLGGSGTRGCEQRARRRRPRGRVEGRPP